MRRAVAAAFLFSFAALGSWLAIAAFRPDPLPLGAPIPRVTLRDGVRSLPLEQLRGPVLIIWFHVECVPCQWELAAVERNLARLRATRIILITGQDSVPRTAIRASWPNLGASELVTWGTVPRDAFTRAFGTSLTPALFVFDRQSKLAHKVVGESKLDRVLAMLD